MDMTTPKFEKPESQKSRCLTIQDLMKYRVGELSPEKRSQVFHHLFVEQCVICQEKYIGRDQGFKLDFPSEFSASKIKILKEQGLIHKPFKKIDTLEKGQIWTTLAKPKNKIGEEVIETDVAVPVYILDPGNHEKSLLNKIPVVPVSSEIKYQVKGEDFLLDQNCPLGYPVILEIWNEVKMLAGNIGEFRGEINNAHAKNIEIFRKEFKQINKKQNLLPEILQWRKNQKEKTLYLVEPARQEKNNIKIKKYKPPLQDSKPFKLKLKLDNDAHVCILGIGTKDEVELLFKGKALKGKTYFLPEKKEESITQGIVWKTIYLLTSNKTFEKLDEKIKELKKKPQLKIEKLFCI